ncbi:hypothetical protein AB434_1973 [Heyndrickxia coagulans]|nr:hypothetical protein AB434_1973 [Heyndrickxia coagulans]KYC77696.1 hypothetical protein B4096_0658 [Heyndrickxia coagulans]
MNGGILKRFIMILSHFFETRIVSGSGGKEREDDDTGKFLKRPPANAVLPCSV